MAIFDTISADIVVAMKAKDKVRLEALRGIKKLFIEAKTAPGSDGTLSDEMATKILAKLSKQGKDTATLYTEQGRPDLAEAELAQVAVIDEYLPQPLTPEELEATLRAIIAQVGATTLKDLGKVMGMATKQLAGRADGKQVSDLAKQLLA